MKVLSKKILMIALSLCSFVCMLFGGVFAFAQTKSVQADATALQTEFTNNGQFTVSKYNGAVPFEYVDGATEGLPAGYSGSVLKIKTTSGCAYANLDFSESKILAADVASIVVRIYSPDFTLGTDEFRTYPTQVQYGTSGYDISSWCNITLNNKTMADMTDANGYLSTISVGVREREETKDTYYYIDRIAVVLKSDFTNNDQFAVSYYTGNAAYTYQFVDGAIEGLPAGYSDAVLKINSKSVGGAPYVNLNFTASKIPASKVVSVVARVYSPDYTSADELRINNTAGSMGGAGAHNLSTWCDVELPLATITGADGNLGSFGFGLRDKGTTSDYFYIDSITVNMKEEAKPVAVTFTGINLYWNNYANADMYCTILEFSGGIGIGELGGDYSDVFAQATLDGNPVDSTNLSFVCRKWVDGAGDSIVMRWVTLPEVGAILHIPAGATFTNGGEDTNVYEFAADMYLQLNGEKWVKIDAPVEGETASFISPWTNFDMFNSEERVLLMYNSTNDWNHEDKGTLASKITYINTQTNATMSITDDSISGWSGQKWIVLTGLNGYDKVVIARGGIFGGVEIPATTLYNVNGCWVATELHAATANCTTIAAGWNNNVASGLSNNILSFDVNPLGNAADATNLAGALSRTSLMVKYNGKTFFELYAGNPAYTISYAHGYNHFYFAIPEADLVEDATFEIENGTPFMNQFLSGIKLAFKNGAWEIVERNVNYTPNFVKIGSINHLDNGDMGFGLSLVYSTTGFVAGDGQEMAASYTGVTINGEPQSVALWGGNQLLFWIKKHKCEVGYNGYSHATLEIAEGAKIVNGNGAEFTLGAATLYLVDGVWTAEKPADYNIFIAEPTTFVGIGANSTKNAIVLQFTDNVTWTEEKDSFAQSILLDGVAMLTADDITLDAVNKTITLNVAGNYSKLEIVAGGEIAGIVIPAVCVYSTENGWSLKPQKTNTLVGVGVFGNNNKPAGNFYHTVLQFSEYFVIGNNAASDATNMAAIECELSTKVKLNGKSFYELHEENPVFYVGYISGGKYFTFEIPQTYLDGEPENGYEYHTLTVEAGTTFGDWLLPEISLVSYDKVWIDAKDFNPTPLAYNGIAYGWNAISNGSNIDTILQFGEYGVDFLGSYNGNVSHADPNNLAKLASEQISTKFTLNGVPANQIDGLTISYAHGYNYLYISIPNYELSANDEYKCVTLHIEQNTVFKKSVLNEVTLYFLNGQWQTEKPDTVATDAEGTYLTANDIFNGTDGEYKLSDVDESVEIISTQQAGVSSIYNFLYKSDSIDFHYSVFTNVSDDFGGVRVMVFRDEGELLQGFNVFVDGALVGAQKFSFVEDEWYAIRIATVMENGTISVSVAVDGIVVVKAETEYSGEIGNQIKLQKSYGSVTFADFKNGDIKKPTINWQGKNVYRYNVGEEKPEDSTFLMVISATDNYDKASLGDADFVVTWQDGAVVDGKLQAGEWTLTLSISDTAGNVAAVLVQVLVFNPDEVAVSFNVNGEPTYALAQKGGLLEKPADPTKAGNAVISYIFDGWYVGDKKWDFANDYVLEEVELTAVFTVEYNEYTVTIVSEGLESGYTYVLKLHHGSTLDESIFAREGYSYILTVGGEEIDEVTVAGDMQVTVVYTANPTTDDSSSEPDTSEPDSSTPDSSTPDSSEPETPNPEPSESSSGCFGSVSGVYMVFVLAFVAAAMLFVKTSKGGKENE